MMKIFTEILLLLLLSERGLEVSRGGIPLRSSDCCSIADDLDNPALSAYAGRGDGHLT